MRFWSFSAAYFGDLPILGYEVKFGVSEEEESSHHRSSMNRLLAISTKTPRCCCQALLARKTCNLFMTAWLLLFANRTPTILSFMSQ